MRKTTLTIKKLEAVDRVDDISFCTSIDGHTLLDHFWAFLKSLPMEGVSESNKNIYLRVQGKSRMGSYVLASIRSGFYGSRQKVFNVSTGNESYDKGPSDAITEESRVLMFLPPDASWALFAIEHTDVSMGDYLLQIFLQALKTRFNNGYLFRTAYVYELNDWLKLGKLSEIKVIAYKKRITHRKGLDDKTLVANLTQSLTPPKGDHFFADSLKKKLLDRELDAADLFEIPSDLDTKTIFTLKHKKRQKSFELSSMGTPVYREVLTDENADQLSDDDFLDRASDSVSEQYIASDVDWNSNYLKNECSQDSMGYKWD